MFIFALHSTSDDQLKIQVMKDAKNAKKLLPNSQKMKCLFLDYFQLLMISQVI